MIKHGQVHLTDLESLCSDKCTAFVASCVDNDLTNPLLMLGIEQSTRGGGGEEEVSFAILKRHPFPAVAAAAVVASGKSGNANS